MQDNEPLMRALAKLIHVNSPDAVLFVGEALVGNDAIDQLTKFNESLIDFGETGGDVRTIDGMLLTKFDTVDDKGRLEIVFVPIWIKFISRGSFEYGSYNWKAYRICRCWVEVSTLEEVKCECCR